MSEKNKPSRGPKVGQPGLGTSPDGPQRWWRRPAFWLWLALVLPLGLIAAHSVLWYVATQQIIDQTTTQLRNLARQGWTTFADVPVRGGYPWAAEVTTPGMRIAGPLLEWDAARVVVRLALLQPRTVHIAIAGKQSARLGNSPLVPFSATRTEVEVDLATPDSSRIELDGLDAATPAGKLTAEAVRLRLDRAALTLNLDLTNAVLPDLRPDLPPDWPLSHTLEYAGLDVTVQGGAPVELTAPALKAWRAGNGQIDIPRLSVGWDKLKLAGHLTVSLDELLQPNLAGQIRLGGYNSLIDALIATNLLAPRPAQAMRAVLGMLARPAADTGPDSVDLPVTLRDRSLDVGRIPLLRTPEFVWPAGK